MMYLKVTNYCGSRKNFRCVKLKMRRVVKNCTTPRDRIKSDTAHISLDILLCSEQSRILSCKHDEAIEIQRAFWGRSSQTVCAGGVAPDRLNTECSEPGILDTIKSQCDGKQHCEIFAHWKSLGEPCRGVPKYLNFTYVCKDKGKASYSVFYLSNET